MFGITYTKIIEFIKQFCEVSNELLRCLWRVLDEGHIIRRSAFFLMWYLTFETLHFCFGLAKGGITADTALVIGALMGPVGLLQGAVFKFYGEGRKKQEGD